MGPTGQRAKFALFGLPLEPKVVQKGVGRAGSVEGGPPNFGGAGSVHSPQFLAPRRSSARSAAMVRFVKYEGLGNDFIVIDVRSGEVAPAPEQAVRWCDRRRGIGADGVLVVGPSERADARMDVINRDGSIAEMCGNGLRCVADHVREGAPGDLRVETAAGMLRCRVEAPGWVSTEIGAGALIDPSVPSHVPDLPAPGIGISFGNPHVVFAVSGPTRPAAEAHGPDLTRHRAFSRGVNVGFARFTGGALELTVYERGAGLTLACGTGAAAAALATWRWHPAAPRPLTVELPGGALIAHHQDGPGLGTVWLEGPARRVFRGEVEEPGGQRL